MSDTLPALRGLNRLADLRPCVLIDTREQTPLTFVNLPSTRGSLQSGDYSLAGLEDHFAVERKSIADLVGSVCAERERFERELHRLRGFHFKRLLIVGSRSEVEAGLYRSKMTPRAVLASLDAFECRYQVPVFWSADPIQAASLIERWGWFYAREHVLACNELLRGIDGCPAASNTSVTEP